MRGIILLVGLLLLDPSTSFAGEAPLVERAHHIGGRSHADCFCRAQGRMYAYGESVCLRTPEGPRLAQCQMELNVTSWTFTEKPCPES